VFVLDYVRCLMQWGFGMYVTSLWVSCAGDVQLTLLSSVVSLC
jgi:hypothetical protein